MKECYVCQKELSLKDQRLYSEKYICLECKKEIIKFREEVVTLSSPSISTIEPTYESKGSSVIFQSTINQSDILSCEDTLLNNPKNKGALQYLAKTYKSKSELNKAQKYFEQLKELCPEEIEWSQHISDIYMARNQLDEALTEMKVALESTQAKQYLEFNIGLILKIKKQHKEAESYFKRVISHGTDKQLIEKSKKIIEL